VACPADVEQVGYRNPLQFLQGNYGATCPRPPEARPDPQAFLACAAAYWQARKPDRKATPAADTFFKTTEPVRLDHGWVRTYRTADGQSGALLQKDGEEVLRWVGEPLWTLYNLHGGPAKIGYPVHEAYDWPEADAQSFEKALLVLEKTTDRARVIWRR